MLVVRKYDRRSVRFLSHKFAEEQVDRQTDNCALRIKYTSQSLSMTSYLKRFSRTGHCMIHQSNRSLLLLLISITALLRLRCRSCCCCCCMHAAHASYVASGPRCYAWLKKSNSTCVHRAQNAPRVHSTLKRGRKAWQLVCDASEDVPLSLLNDDDTSQSIHVLCICATGDAALIARRKPHRPYTPVT